MLFQKQSNYNTSNNRQNRIFGKDISNSVHNNEYLNLNNYGKNSKSGFNIFDNKEANSKIVVEDLRSVFDMEEVDYRNRHVPEEVAPYTKEIFKMLREEEVILSRYFIIFKRESLLLFMVT